MKTLPEIKKDIQKLKGSRRSHNVRPLIGNIFSSLQDWLLNKDDQIDELELLGNITAEDLRSAGSTRALNVEFTVNKNKALWGIVVKTKEAFKTYDGGYYEDVNLRCYLMSVFNDNTKGIQEVGVYPSQEVGRTETIQCLVQEGNTLDDFVTGEMDVYGLFRSIEIE